MVCIRTHGGHTIVWPGVWGAHTRRGLMIVGHWFGAHLGHWSGCVFYATWGKECARSPIVSVCLRVSPSGHIPSACVCQREVNQSRMDQSVTHCAETVEDWILLRSVGQGSFAPDWSESRNENTQEKWHLWTHVIWTQTHSDTALSQWLKHQGGR